MPTVVTNELDLVDAIIGHARRYRAHTIVVGTRPRSWLERFINPSIAAAVADGADHSVLITPRLQ
jgi:nucleotide-binding universal stress UspA family protein